MVRGTQKERGIAMTHAEAIQKHHEVGAAYIELGAKTKELAKLYKEHKEIGQNVVSWDFDKLYSLYQDLGDRFTKIGQVLAKL